ncbi:MAG: hypothetical protein RR550_00185 [Rikenellaceae bacterium]
MNKSTTTQKARQNDIMTLADKEQEMLKAKELLTKVKENPKERAKVKVEIHDKYNTIFFLSPSKVNDPSTLIALFLGLKINY